MEVDLDHVFGNPKFLKGAPIYPVKLLDIFKLYDYSSCLLIPKNSTSDVSIIKMTYLAYLINVSYSHKENHHLYDKLKNLLKLTFRTENLEILIDDNEKYYISINDEFEINEQDFEKFREIIAIQNMIETKNNSVGSDFDKAKEKAKKDLARRNGEVADIEQQIIAYKCEQKESYENIRNMTIYQFRKEIERIDLIKSADILQSAQYSGMVSFKKDTKIPHWLDQIKSKNPDEDLVLSKSQLDQIAQKNGLISK